MSMQHDTNSKGELSLDDLARVSGGRGADRDLVGAALKAAGQAPGIGTFTGGGATAAGNMVGSGNVPVPNVAEQLVAIVQKPVEAIVSFFRKW